MVVAYAFSRTQWLHCAVLVVVAPVLLFSVATIDGHDSNITAWQDIFVVGCKHMGLWFIVGWDIGKGKRHRGMPGSSFLSPSQKRDSAGQPSDIFMMDVMVVVAVPHGQEIANVDAGPYDY